MYFIFSSGILAILFGLYLIQKIVKLPAGNDKMQEIAKAIQDGAKAYLNRQYSTIAVVAVILFIIIGLIVFFFFVRVILRQKAVERHTKGFCLNYRFLANLSEL